MPRERAILVVFCHPTVVGGRRPFPPKMGDRSDPLTFDNRPRRQISACNVPTVRASGKKVQLWRIGCRLRTFQRAINEGGGLSLTSLNGGRNLQFAGFYRASYASAVLAVVILSVCPSVCHTRALWVIQRTDRQYFYTTRKSNHSSFLMPKILAKSNGVTPNGGAKERWGR